jgi:hypothetical protein
LRPCGAALLTDVADSILLIARLGATMEFGQSERKTMTSLLREGFTASTPPTTSDRWLR